MRARLVSVGRTGQVLVWVLIAFMVLTLLMTSMAFVVRQGIFETAKQEERLQTYYIALAGVDLVYAALMDPSYNPKYIQTAITQIKSTGNPIADTITVEVDGQQVGTAEITIDIFKDDKDISWLRITSIGQLTGKSTRVPSTMRINTANTNQVIRERVGK